MKRLSKFCGFLCSMILLFTGAIALTGCKNENPPTNNAAVEFISSNIEKIKSSYAIANETSKLVSELDASGNYQFDMGEFGFIVSIFSSKINEINEYEINGEFLKIDSEEIDYLVKLEDGKYKNIYCFAYGNEIYSYETLIDIQLENKILNITLTQEAEGGNNSIKFVYDFENQFYTAEFENTETDQNGNLNYCSKEMYEAKIVDNELFAQCYSHTKYYEDGIVSLEHKRLYKIKTNFELLLNITNGNNEVVINSFVGCYENNVSDVYSLNNGVSSDFVADNIVVEWAKN